MSSPSIITPAHLRARQFVEQTVTTDDEAIFLPKSERSAVDLDVACDTQCSGEDPVVGVSRGVSLPQLPAWTSSAVTLWSRVNWVNVRSRPCTLSPTLTSARRQSSRSPAAPIVVPMPSRSGWAAARCRITRFAAGITASNRRPIDPQKAEWTRHARIRCDLATWVEVLRQSKTVTAHDDIFVVLAHQPYLRPPGRSQRGHQVLLAFVIRGRQELMDFARRKKAAHKGKGSLAVFRVVLESQGPGIELLAGGLAQEGTDVGQRHTRLAQGIDDPRIGHADLASSTGTLKPGPPLTGRGGPLRHRF